MKIRTSFSLKKTCIFFSTILIFVISNVLFLPTTAYGAVVFQENFDNQQEGASCGGYNLTNWGPWQCFTETVATFDGITHKSGEVTSPGRGGTGKSLKIWRHAGVFGDYTGVPSKGVYGNVWTTTLSNIYMRYYMRVPALFLNAQTFKLWRLNVTGGSGEIYLYLRDPNWTENITLDNAVMSVYDGGPHTTLLTSEQLRTLVWDGNWHCLEFHMGLNNNTLQLWVDGILRYSNVSFTWTAGGVLSGLQHFSVGNTMDHTGRWHDSWQAMELDDLVFADSYIGPTDGGGSSDTTPPTVSLTDPSQNASVSGTIPVSATASDNVGVAGVQFKVDGNNIGAEDTSSPYSTSFNTTSVSNGTHTLTATARDAAGNTTTSSPVTVTVSNAATAVPTVSLTASPASIASSQSSTLTWSSTNATSCTASNGWTGTKATSGSESVSPTSTNTYVLTCTGSGGSGNSSTTVRVTGVSRTVFFTEGYEDTNFASRGWYDMTTGTVDTAEHHSGNASLRCTYTAGSQICTAPRRHKFTESDSVYLSYWVKYSSNFVGSGLGYHPHEFYFLTNLNGDYDGLAFDYLTLYLESHWSSSSSGNMQAAFQDGQNIDQARLGQNLIGVTENRAVAGCNGSPSGYAGECYNRGDGIYVNNVTLATSELFTTSNKNNWNHVEAYYRLNSISNGIGQADGIIRIWFNNSLVFERTNAILRTGQRPTMKINQFDFAPWISDGSPVEQTMWIDDLVVASERSQDINILYAPINLRIIN